MSISFGIKKRDPGKSQEIKDVSELMLLKVVETRGDLEGYLEVRCLSPLAPNVAVEIRMIINKRNCEGQLTHFKVNHCNIDSCPCPYTTCYQIPQYFSVS